ncbi:MAG: hypothetical protein RSA27_01150 [Oscillospiraceae bacterium]
MNAIIHVGDDAHIVPNAQIFRIYNGWRDIKRDECDPPKKTGRM